MPKLAKTGGSTRWPRQIVLVIALVLAWTSAMQAGGMAFQVIQPSLSLRFDADNPVALVRSAKANVVAGTSEENGGARALAAARRSIAQSPLNADAFGLYGLVQMANSEPDVVGRQVAMADRLSRRDLSTQLFLIDDSVRRNDVAEALRHYDAAMRVEESVRPTLLPILADAMREPAIRKRFLPYMDASTPWLEAFSREAVSNASDPASIAALAIEAGGFPDQPRFATRVPELLSVLVASNDLDTALKFFRSVGGGSPDLLKTADFTEESTKPTLAPFTWQPVTVNEIDSIFVGGMDGNLEFEARMAAGQSGHVLRKLFALPPGNYALSIPMRIDDHTPGDIAQLRVACVDRDGQRIVADKKQDLEDEFVFNQQFAVPGNCPYQMVIMMVTTAPTTGDIVMTFESPRLQRASTS